MRRSRMVLIERTASTWTLELFPIAGTHVGVDQVDGSKFAAQEPHSKAAMQTARLNQWRADSFHHLYRKLAELALIDSEGAPVIRSTARWVLGNAITSRNDSV